MSPIRGLTDTVRPAFRTIGKLRKGGEAKRTTDGKMIKMGDDLSYFRFTSDQPEVIEAFADAYGRTPALVRAYLPYPLVDDNFSCWKEAWSQGGLVHRCDGQTMTIWLDDKGKYQRTPKSCDGGCDEVGRLTLIIPELLRAGYVGYVCLETHGLNDLLSIQACLLAAFASRMGNPLGLRGIEWNVRRVKEKISTPMGNGKRARRDKWLVKIEPAADWVQLQLEQAHATTMALPAPTATQRTVDVETGEIVEVVDDDYQEEAEVEAQPVGQPEAQSKARTVPPSQDEYNDEAPPDYQPKQVTQHPRPAAEAAPANPTPTPERPTQAMLTRFAQLWRDAAELKLDTEDLVIKDFESRESVVAKGRQLAARIDAAKAAAFKAAPSHLEVETSGTKQESAF